MLGLIIAALVVAWNFFVGHTVLEAAFFAGLDVLWIWQIIFTAISALMVIAFAFGFTGFTTLMGSSFGNRLGGTAGFAAGGIMSFVMLIAFAATRAMMLGGTWLLMNSGNPDLTFAEFDQNKLIGGGVLLAAGLLFSTLSSASSSVTQVRSM